MLINRFFILWALFSCFSQLVSADELRPGYLQLTQSDDPTVFEVFWKVPARGPYEKLALDVQFDENTQVINKPKGGFVSGAIIEQWQIANPQQLSNSTINIIGLNVKSTDVLMRLEYLNGTTLSHRFTPDSPSFTISEPPSWTDTLKTYFVLGVEHIIFGIDHLLFVLVLLLLVPSMAKLITTITAFTIAHSITLILASLGLVWVPIAPMEACIALSIVFIATEIIRSQQGHKSFTQQRPWLVAFIFGLLHGLGFAAALGEIGLPQNALLTSLVIFNIGVEAGQLAFVFAMVILWKMIKPLKLHHTPWLMRLPAYLIGSIASFWVFERVASFWA